MRLFIFAALLIPALTGCTLFSSPTFMPAGYSYHGDDYKSPPGPELRHGRDAASAPVDTASVEERREPADMDMDMPLAVPPVIGAAPLMIGNETDAPPRADHD